MPGTGENLKLRRHIISNLVRAKQRFPQECKRDRGYVKHAGSCEKNKLNAYSFVQVVCKPMSAENGQVQKSQKF